MREQILHRFEADVNSEREKADADQPMRECFSIFRSRSIAQSPHQHQAGNNLDYRIEAEADQRDTASKNAGNNPDNRFECCPADAEKFNSPASSSMNRQSFCEFSAHFRTSFMITMIRSTISKTPTVVQIHIGHIIINSLRSR